MGQPELSLEQFEEIASQFSAEFLEIRGIEGSLDILSIFNKRPIRDINHPIRVLSSSLQLKNASIDDIEDFVEYARLAKRLSVPYIRVFGGLSENDSVTSEDLNDTAKMINMVRTLLRKHEITSEILLETHGAFSASELCLQLNKRLIEPINLIWDSHHTWQLAKENLSTTANAIWPFVRHIHFKDSVIVADKYHYVLPGRGEFPTQELFGLLRSRKFTGGLSLEWEKLWHPELPPLTEALSLFFAIANREDSIGPDDNAKLWN